MKKTVKIVILVLIITIVTFVLGYVGVILDQQMWAENATESIGHGVPVFTMILPMLWLGLWLFIGIISLLIKIVKSIIIKIRSN